MITVIVTCFDQLIDRRRFMLKVLDLGMNTADYVYILPDYVPSKGQSNIWLHPSGTDQDGRDTDARIAFLKAFVVIYLSVPQPFLQYPSFICVNVFLEISRNMNL